MAFTRPWHVSQALRRTWWMGTWFFPGKSKGWEGGWKGVWEWETDGWKGTAPRVYLDKNECSQWIKVRSGGERQSKLGGVSWVTLIHPRGFPGAWTDLSKMNTKVLPDARGWGQSKQRARIQMRSHCWGPWGEASWATEVGDGESKSERASNICHVYTSLKEARSPSTHQVKCMAPLFSLPFFLSSLGRVRIQDWQDKAGVEKLSQKNTVNDASLLRFLASPLE